MCHRFLYCNNISYLLATVPMVTCKWKQIVIETKNKMADIFKIEKIHTNFYATQLLDLKVII